MFGIMLGFPCFLFSNAENSLIFVLSNAMFEEVKSKPQTIKKFLLRHFDMLENKIRELI